MDALITLALLAVLLAAPCLVQLVLWTAYAGLKAAGTLTSFPTASRSALTP